MGDIRQDFDEYYGTCYIEYCHVCQNARQDLDPCKHCGFLFCAEHMAGHDCIGKRNETGKN